ncbi:MAG: Ppx/GppA family phosphatase [Rhodospirillales bacterium]|nr:Ppx/GppA family phosphatase [Rhodospirillales bacterium]
MPAAEPRNRAHKKRRRRFPARRRPRRPDTPREGQHGAAYAALDLGTNNCRLLIAEPFGAGGFRVVDSFSRIVRLGEGLEASGALSEAACGRAIAALKICAGKVRARGARRLRGVATEACRRAGNGRDFLRRVDAETGLRLETISPAEEARLTLLGCAPLLDSHCPFALVFDIGGGSTELMWVALSGASPPHLLGIESLPLGVVTLAETESGGALSPAEYDTLVERIGRRLGPFDSAHGVADRAARGEVFVLGTSGTMTTLGGVYLDLPRYDRSRVDGLTMDSVRASAIGRRLACMAPAERARHPCIGPERADLVAFGCAVLEAICRRWPVKTLRAADRGIREGLLIEMIAADRDKPTRTSPA